MAADQAADVEPVVEIERYRAQRLAQARPMSLYGIYYAVGDDMSTTLFLVNKIADPVQIEIYAQGGDQEVLPLGRHILEPNRHLKLSLAEMLEFASPSFYTGSLRVEFLGDPATLQGWMVLERKEQLFEVALVAPSTILSHRLTSFWDTRSLSKASVATPVYHLLHVGTQPLEADIVTRQAGTIVYEETLELSPGQHLTLRPGLERPLPLFGSLEVSHDGAPGALVGLGFLEGKEGTWARLPMLELEDEGLATTYHSLRLHEGSVTLYNPNEHAARIELETLDWQTGEVTASKQMVIGPRLVRTVHLPETPGGFRCRVRGDRPFAVTGWEVGPAPVLVEQAWFPTKAAHPNGSYPLPSLDSYRVSHEVVNLSASETRLVGQVDWAGGSYTLGPITVPPGGAHELDFEELVQAEGTDVLGRRLDPEYRNAFFRWTSQGEGRRLLGRVHVRAREGHESFGFNCAQCCPEMPFGTVVPDLVEFVPGETPLFQACVSYSTCNGTMGPFPTTPTTLDVPSPFTWDGVRVGASSAADGELSFEATESGIDLVCFSFLRLIFNKGRAEMCQRTFNPMEYDGAVACTHQTSTCFRCNACCENIAQEKVCRGKNLAVVEGERRTCLGLCAEDLCK